jgi:hypothetical protein
MIHHWKPTSLSGYICHVYAFKSPAAIPFLNVRISGDITIHFRNNHDQGERYFVERKETSLISMELETGRIKATLNSECPFIPDDFDDDSQDVGLDELEGSAPLISAPTEIYIGRTGTSISPFSLELF